MNRANNNKKQLFALMIQVKITYGHIRQNINSCIDEIDAIVLETMISVHDHLCNLLDSLSTQAS